MVADRWTADIIEDRLAAAAATLRRSRAVGVGPSGTRSAWPAMAPTKEDQRMAYGYNAATAPRIEPSSAELTALDAVLGWMSRYLSREACTRAKLPPDAGWVAWQRATGATWPQISDARGRAAQRPTGGNSREACRQIARQAHEHVALCLSRDRVPLHVGTTTEGASDPPPVATGRHETLPRSMDARAWVLNRRPCGECRFLLAVDGTTRCGLLGGAVAPAQRAQHPAGEPCFEEKMP